MSVKVVTPNPVRLSYPALFQPRSAIQGGTPKYSATLLIPKSDTETVTAVTNAIKAELAEASSPAGRWKGKAPAAPSISFYDGDKPNPRSGEEWGPECKGCYVLRTSSANQPDIIDEYGNKALEAHKFYAGCYCYFSINFAAYDTAGNKGIGAFLNCVMFAKDGDPLEGHNDAKTDFAAFISKQSAAPAASANPFGGFDNPFGC